MMAALNRHATRWIPLADEKLWLTFDERMNVVDVSR